MGYKVIMTTSTITAIGLFIIKGIFYGLSLAFGFWLMGIFTKYVEYYIALWIHDRDRFWSEIQNGVVGAPVNETL